MGDMVVKFEDGEKVLRELLRLRVKDVDSERGQLTVLLGKGDKDRVTVSRPTCWSVAG